MEIHIKVISDESYANGPYWSVLVTTDGKYSNSYNCFKIIELPDIISKLAEKAAHQLLIEHICL